MHVRSGAGVGAGAGPLQSILAVLRWSIMHHLGIAEIGMIVLFIIGVVLAVWWAVVSLRR